MIASDIKAFLLPNEANSNQLQSIRVRLENKADLYIIHFHDASFNNKSMKKENRERFIRTVRNLTNITPYQANDHLYGWKLQIRQNPQMFTNPVQDNGSHQNKKQK